MITEPKVRRHPAASLCSSLVATRKGTFAVYLICSVAAALGASACAATPEVQTGQDTLQVIEEEFITAGTRPHNVDSPAVWHAPDGSAMLLATAKSSDALLVYDASTGKSIGGIGRSGSGLGEFRRPNGILVLGDVAFVVERDNRRVQVLRLPDGKPLGSFGQSVLRRPYGIAAVEYTGSWDVYVTDAYTRFLAQLPPSSELGERVKRFRVTIVGDSLHAELLDSFGDTEGPGVLRQVESILADPYHDRLLIADEASIDVKVYDLDGAYTGRTLGQGFVFTEPEGMALYDCGEGDGYLLLTDQTLTTSFFHVLDRRSLEHLGVYRGAVTANTDGVVLTQRPIGDWEDGVFYAVHDDRAVSAILWSDIADSLDLESCELSEASVPEVAAGDHP
jgi:3-phytase